MAVVVPVVNPNGANPIGPFRSAVAVVTSDTVPLAVPSSAVYVGGTGDLTYVPAGASGASPSAAAVTLKAVPVGTLLPISAQFIMATNTSATLLVALY